MKDIVCFIIYHKNKNNLIEKTFLFASVKKERKKQVKNIHHLLHTSNNVGVDLH